MMTIDAIRALLRADPRWCVYALGDLDPRRQQHCAWYERGASVALVYHEFGTPILFCAGTPDVLAEVPELDTCLLQIPETFLTALEARFVLDWVCPVLRMSLDSPRVLPSPGVRVEPLGTSDEAELRALYDDGRESGEEPDFFIPTQLSDGTFFGVREDGRLIAAGGTHLYSAVEHVGAIGNVYTRRSHRGRGHASAVMAAIVGELAARRTEIIALNVRAANLTAIRLYERLGFRVHARFWEGRAFGRRAPA
jgi:GNAT superfamily N-acetyltransferase